MNVLPRLRDFRDQDYNPFLADSLIYGDNADPYDVIRRMRAQGTVVAGDYRMAMGLHPDVTYPAGAQHFMIVGTDEVTKVLSTPDTFSNHAWSFNLGISFGHTLSVMDAPDHPRYRRVFQKVFLPKAINGWGTEIVDPVVTELMDDFIASGEADLVSQFTMHYPFRVIYRQLALPLDECAVFHKLAIAQTVILVDKAHGMEAADNLGEYFTRLIAERRDSPGDDLISLLVQAEADGERLPDDVLISFLRQLVNAAGDTTFRGTSVLLTKLLENPDQLEAVRNDRSLIGNAIEEALRIEGPVIVVPRWTTTDVELGGVWIPAGSIVHAVGGAVNRDPARFPDPDRFDIRRKNASQHYAFLTGPHVCIGRHLARVEMTRALTAVLDRLHNLRLDPSKPAPRIKGALMRVTDCLNVKFDPAA